MKEFKLHCPNCNADLPKSNDTVQCSLCQTMVAPADAVRESWLTKTFGACAWTLGIFALTVVASIIYRNDSPKMYIIPAVMVLLTAASAWAAKHFSRNN